MKKKTLICSLAAFGLVLIAFAFVLGMLIGKNQTPTEKTDPEEQISTVGKDSGTQKPNPSGENTTSVTEEKAEKSVVGVYVTSSWNGKEGTLALYQDGTCLYPTGATGTWKEQEDHVVIYLPVSKSYSGTVTAYWDDSLSLAEAKSLVSQINTIANVKGTMFQEDCYWIEFVATATEEEIQAAIDSISRIGGIKQVQWEADADTPEPDEHTAVVMEKGLVLHKRFFEKVSN